MDAIVLPHDMPPPDGRPIDIEEPAGEDPAFVLPEPSHAGVPPEEKSSVNPADTQAAPIAAGSARRSRGKSRRQGLLFASAAVVVAAASGGMIFHKPLLAVWARLRAPHPTMVSGTIPLPKPHSPATLLKAGGSGHSPMKPLDNSIAGFSVVPRDHNTPASPGTVGHLNPDKPAKPAQIPLGGRIVRTAASPPVKPGTVSAGALKPGAGQNQASAATPTMIPVAHPAMSSGGSGGARQASGSLPSSGTAAGGQPEAVPKQPVPPAQTALVGPIPPKGTLQSIPHPVVAAAKLVAAPASRTDEVRTDSLVAALGRLVGELRSETAAEAVQIAALQHHTDAELTAFNQRLTFDQAHEALARAAARPIPSKVPAASDRVFPAASRAVPPVNPASYSIQAASPGLAMIVRNGTTYEVSVGSIVPGVGRVIAIVESGSTWVVRTDHGVIP
ncbi:MAG: hypothetical protein PHT60_14945 [Acidiphilium sp.]|nr:hypothetical protein [Acidiphilium sp.]MDD4937059.1 hypothetical protein [Acidiphilium sp.]